MDLLFALNSLPVGSERDKELNRLQSIIQQAQQEAQMRMLDVQQVVAAAEELGTLLRSPHQAEVGDSLYSISFPVNFTLNLVDTQRGFVQDNDVDMAPGTLGVCDGNGW